MRRLWNGTVHVRVTREQTSQWDGQTDSHTDGGPILACLTHQQTLLLTAAPEGSKAIAAGCAAVTASAKDVGLALTLP